ncbi:MAG: phosphoenolpyruvate carboxykinase (ATP) [Candidatus Dadabacteria bacterium]|nr:phosphoenolpyruvate carboxykinase (ATP) [Candidatus Dadabacteria bacterium]
MQKLTDKDLAEQHGIKNPGGIYYNLPIPALYEEVIRREEGLIGEGGTLVAYTGVHTGRSPADRFIVKEPGTENDILWGPVNKAISPEHFDSLHKKILDYYEGKDLFVRDLSVCAHPEYRTNVRVISEYAWHNVFVNNLFIRPDPQDLPHKSVGFTVLCAPGVKADPETDGTRSETFIILNFEKRMAIIGGTQYAGEMKKSVFSALNFLLPEKGVFPMHCSANVGKDGDVALFFGLSGTGKTTLSADPDRALIGDDEHGWFDNGVFNFEGGCYAKAIKLNPKTEPGIYNASLRFGSVLENVKIDAETKKIDFDSDEHTENTRVAYQIDFLTNIVPEGVGGIPKTIFMLTYDAFGVLPPISKLTSEQAMYYFTLGYTAKVAGTERGVSEPQATFSSCFGEPFLPRPPLFYAEMLKGKLEESGATVWLLNTGITGGPYGVGNRMPLPQTRALVTAAVDGTLEKGSFNEVPVFGLEVPTSCPGVDEKLLEPKKSWDDPSEYDSKAAELAARFEEEFAKHKS